MRVSRIAHHACVRRGCASCARMTRGGTWTGDCDPPGRVVNRIKYNPKNQRVKFYFTLLDCRPQSNYSRAMRHTKWTDRLAFDVALTLEGSGEPMAELMARHHITSHDIMTYHSDHVFLKKVDHYRTEVRDKGMTFRLKARAQAEELLGTSYLLIHDPSVSPAVKADLIKSTVKWAGLEPKDNVQADAGGGVKITINLGSKPEDSRVIELAPEVEDVADYGYLESVQ